MSNEVEWIPQPLFTDEEMARLMWLATNVDAYSRGVPSQQQIVGFLRRCEIARAQETVLRKILIGELKVERYDENGQAVLVPVEPKAKDKE